MKLVLFDCDGTLVDSQHAIYEAMRLAFEAAGLVAPPRPRVLSVVGLSLPHAIQRLAPEAEASVIDALSEGYKRAFAALRDDPAHHEPLYPGTMEAIRALLARGDVVLGVATGKSRRGVHMLFDRFGLHPHFVTIQTADTHPSKPDPSMILRAMAETGARPGDTVMVGDTTYDIEMAVRASVGAIGVGWGYHSAAELRQAGAHALIERYDELHGALDRVLKELVA